MIPIRTAALAMGTFFAATYTLCVALHLVIPPSALANEFWSSALPGFKWISPGSFLLGLAEIFAYGLYAGGFFSFLYNSFAGRRATTHRNHEVGEGFRRAA